jgi:serine protease inhibitor
MIQLFIMLYVASKDRTETDLQKYFSFTDKAATFKSLIQLNVDLNKTKVFTNSNIICIPDTTQLNDKYFKLLANVGDIIHYNYNATNKCVKTVNDIAARTTNNIIDNVVNDNMLQFPTQVVLINIIYFYSKWKLPFDSNLTTRERFYGGNATQVNMMNQRDNKFNYFEDKANQVLEMDYDDGFFSMGFILPHATTGNIDFTSADVENYIQRLVLTEISILKIPKFKHEFKYKVDNVFRENGLDSLFHNLETELIDTPIKISYIIHGAVIIVDESGTKAAAHTTMLSQYNDCVQKTSKNVTFIADHPFLYYIRYKPQNVIIFVGQHF